VTPTDSSVTPGKLSFTDGATIKFGTDSEVELTHNADKGLILKHTATGDDKPVSLTLQTGETDIAADDVIGKIEFQAPDEGTGTDAILTAAAIQARSEGDFSSSSNATELQFMTGASEAATTKMTLSSNGLLGLGTDAPQRFLHIVGTDGTTSLSEGNSRTTLFLDNAGANYVNIASANDANGAIFFSDADANNVGTFQYSHSNNDMVLKVNANSNHGLRIDSSNNLSTNGETAPDVALGGLCLNMGANDAQILTFKSSDIAHGITAGTGNNAETDTYGSIKKVDSNNGGCKLSGFTEGSSVMAIELFGYTTTPDSAFSVSSQGIVQVRSVEKSGSSYTGVGNDDNIFGVKNDGSTKFIVRGDGDIGYDGGASAYDEYEDAHLARALDLSHGNGIIDSKFDQFVKYNHEDLAKAGLVGRERDGTPNHFINITGFQRLHNGAIWQQYEKHQRLAEAVYEMAKETLGEDKADAILKKHDIKLLN